MECDGDQLPCDNLQGVKGWGVSETPLGNTPIDKEPSRVERTSVVLKHIFYLSARPRRIRSTPSFFSLEGDVREGDGRGRGKGGADCGGGRREGGGEGVDLVPCDLCACQGCMFLREEGEGGLW